MSPPSLRAWPCDIHLDTRPDAVYRCALGAVARAEAVRGRAVARRRPHVFASTRHGVKVDALTEGRSRRPRHRTTPPAGLRPGAAAGDDDRSPTSPSRSRSSRILSGCLTLFGFAMNTGGPAVMTLGWLVVGFFVTLVALGMAEVASSYPTAGGLYYWAAKLAEGQRPGLVAGSPAGSTSLGQVAVTAGIDFGLAFFINAFLNLRSASPPTRPSPSRSTASSCSSTRCSTRSGIRLVALLNDVSRLVARRRRRAIVVIACSS